MLSGWARFKYPHLFHAAVSSSSPLLAQVDFPQYAEVVRADLATSGYDIGGSEACAAAVETGKIFEMKTKQEDTRIKLHLSRLIWCQEKGPRVIPSV